ncbi:MAG: LamG domain-containing protein [Anaerolineae bacterium]|nr:LamG domain-containing protein [Anaerolineae bacterium]
MPTTFKLEIDWDRDSSWSDETAYVRRIHTRAGFATPGDAVADAGRCDLTLDNTTARFSPGNTEGLLYGKLLPRRPVKVSATDGTTTWVLFRGFIEHLAPDAGDWGTGHCTIRCVDGIALLTRQRISIAHADSQAVDEAVDDIVSAVYTPPDTAYSDNGDTLTHVGRAWTPEHTTAHNALRDIAAAVYGRFFVARDGTATLLTRTDLQDPSVSAAITIGDPILAPYSTRVTATQPDDLIAYWPLWEASGGTAYDYSGNARDITANGVTWGQPGIGDDHTAAGFDGVNDDFSGIAAVLGSIFDGNAATILLWAKVSSVLAGDSYLLRFRNFVGNGYSIRRWGSDGTVRSYVLGKFAISDAAMPADWLCVAVTVDTTADEMKFYVNGVQNYSTQTGLSSWNTGSSLGDNATRIGSAGSNGNFPGAIAHVAVWNTVLSPAEIAALAEV